MVGEVIDCVLEGAREQLPPQIYGKEMLAGVDVLVARHAWVTSQNQYRHVDAGGA